jgi:hypothetical protein
VRHISLNDECRSPLTWSIECNRRDDACRRKRNIVRSSPTHHPAFSILHPDHILLLPSQENKPTTISPTGTFKMSFLGQQPKPLATSAAAPPSLLAQVGMAGTAAVITVSFIHPIDVVKVCPNKSLGSDAHMTFHRKRHVVLVI